MIVLSLFEGLCDASVRRVFLSKLYLGDSIVSNISSQIGSYRSWLPVMIDIYQTFVLEVSIL
jgi:hypothetical protein